MALFIHNLLLFGKHDYSAKSPDYLHLNISLSLNYGNLKETLNNSVSFEPPVEDTEFLKLILDRISTHNRLFNMND